MFEPLINQLRDTGGNILSSLARVENHLATLAGNAEAKVEKAQFLTRAATGTTGSAGVEGEETLTLEIRVHQAREWRVRNVACVGGKEGVCAVYLNAATPQNLLGVLSPSLLAAQSVRWYIPTNGTLLFVFTKQPKKQDCSVNVQAEAFDSGEPIPSESGRSEEFIESPARTEPVPSGHPVV